MAKKVSPTLTLVTYHRIYSDIQGESHFDTVTVEQGLAQAAPPAAPFYVSADGPASKYRFYTFEPGWIGELHPCPTRQFLALMSGAVEMETTDGTVRRFGPGDLVLLEDTSGKGHVTRNISDGYSTFLVVPVPAA
ncbi:MAG: cupin domain-containing protein [Methanomicrobiales archaeon]|nr:cupin domain-containing protein [Methanomicrobiales archaeon]